MFGDVSDGEVAVVPDVEPVQSPPPKRRKGASNSAEMARSLIVDSARPVLRSSAALVTEVMIARVRRCILSRVFTVLKKPLADLAENIDDSEILGNETIEESEQLLASFYEKHITVPIDASSKEKETWLSLVLRIVLKCEEMIQEMPVHSSSKNKADTPKMQLVPYKEREDRHTCIGIGMKMPCEDGSKHIVLGEIYKSNASVPVILTVAYQSVRYESVMNTHAFVFVRFAGEKSVGKILTPGTSAKVADNWMDVYETQSLISNGDIWVCAARTAIEFTTMSCMLCNVLQKGYYAPEKEAPIFHRTSVEVSQ